MATLGATLHLTRTVVSEVTENPNVPPRYVVAGTSGSIMASGGGQTKIDEIVQAGSFRSYGDESVRLILGAGQTQTQTLALMALTPDQVDTLTDLIGHTICYRNPLGQRIFGAFLSMQISRLPGSGTIEDNTLLANVGLSIQTISYDETV